jgi:leader peptidase (prepilin peptidase)/N-methyltransferase
MEPIYLLPVLLGWVAGLFVNYASDVLPATRRFSQPVCLHCQTAFSLLDYLTLRACRNCGKARSLRNWLVQILAPASFLYFWLSPSKVLGFWLGAIVLIYFAIITVIDLEHRLILHPTSLFGAALGLVVGTYIYSTLLKYTLLQSLGASVAGGIIGFGIMFLLYQIGTYVARFRARKMQSTGQADDEEEALGGGDVYLLGVLGLMAGYRFIQDILIIGVLLGGLASILLIISFLIRRRYANSALMTFIPYGPFFIIGAFLKFFAPY